MRVKHWAGYGCVNAKCLRRTAKAVSIEVTGNHECGLEPYYFDNRDWERWLGKRFKVGDIRDVMYGTWWSDKDDCEHMTVIFVKGN